MRNGHAETTHLHQETCTRRIMCINCNNLKDDHIVRSYDDGHTKKTHTEKIKSVQPSVSHNISQIYSIHELHVAATN